MTSAPSKPFNDAASRAIGHALRSSANHAGRAQAAGQHVESAKAAERQPSTLTGRGSAPTGAPMEAKAPMGGEGNLSARAQARKVGAPALLARMQGMQRLKGFLPRLEWWRVDVHTGWPIGAHLVLREGLFVYAGPVQLAMLFPWFKG